jgi:N-acetylglucosaminyl-diphospho-decaprenol L-rhamnosyltransferase
MLTKKTLLLSIVNYRSSEWLLPLLADLESVQIPPNVSLSLRVLDNASNDPGLNSIESKVNSLKKKFASSKLIKSNSNLGFGRGHNLVFEEFTTEDGTLPDYFGIINPDTRCTPKVLEKLMGCLEANKEIALVSPAITNNDGSSHRVCRRFPSLLSEFEEFAQWGPFSKLLKNYQVAYNGNQNEINFPDWVPASFVLIRGEVFKQVGGFSDNYFLYYEDIDLCKRVRRMGGQIAYFPFVSVSHFIGASTGVYRENEAPKKTRREKYWFESRKIYHRNSSGYLALLVRNFASLLALLLYQLKCLVLFRTSNLPKNFTLDFIRYSF